MNILFFGCYHSIINDHLNPLPHGEISELRNLQTGNETVLNEQYLSLTHYSIDTRFDASAIDSF